MTMLLRHTCGRVWWLALASLWLATGGVVAQETSPLVGEYQVKAAFIYNFIKFTEWPAHAFAATNSPIVIGIIGEDPFGRSLDEAIKGESVHDHPLMVKRSVSGEELRRCQVIFISRSEADHVEALLLQLSGSPALTISDLPAFAERGGMVNLTLVKKSVKMEINQAVTEAAGLQTSGKLLQLARIVKSK